MYFIHKNYDLLSVDEKSFVDVLFREAFAKAKDGALGYSLLGDDRAEYAVEAVATWLVESAKEAGKTRTPYVAQLVNGEPEIGYTLR